jgi:RNA polymerase sigma-70 factor (ECF subfamily)
VTVNGESSSAELAISGDDFPRLRSELQRAVEHNCPPSLAACSEDLVQQALLRLIKLPENGGGERTYNTTFLWRVAYSELIDEIRRRQRRPEYAPEAECSPDTQLSSDPDPERQARSREIGRGIAECLNLMARPRRRAVTLKLHGHTVPQIADMLGWNKKKAENLVQRGIVDLRKCLKSMGLQP